MEVKNILESSLCFISGYNHTMDIKLFSAVVKARTHKEKGKDKSSNQRLKHLNQRPMSLQNEVYNPLRALNFVDENSTVDLNSNAFLDEWSLLRKRMSILQNVVPNFEYKNLCHSDFEDIS